MKRKKSYNLAFSLLLVHEDLDTFHVFEIYLKVTFQLPMCPFTVLVFKVPVSVEFLVTVPHVGQTSTLFLQHLLPSVSIINKAQGLQDMGHTLKVKASFLLSCLLVLVFWQLVPVRFSRLLISNSQPHGLQPPRLSL